jgi:hypothetical protein
MHTTKSNIETYKKQNVHLGGEEGIQRVPNISLGLPPIFKFAFCYVSKHDISVLAASVLQ